MSDSDGDDDDFIPFKRDRKALDALRKSKPKFAPVSLDLSDEESSSSSSSSSSSDDDDNSKEREEDERLDQRALVKKRMMAGINQKVEEATALHQPAMVMSSKLADDVRKKARSTVDAVRKTIQTIQESEDSDIEEVAKPTAPRRGRFVLSDEESELEDRDDVASGDEVEDDESEEEEEKFHIKFNGDRVVSIATDPTRPLQEAFDKYIKAQPAGAPDRRFVFRFDGEVIKGDRTPEDVGMESGDQVDVKVK